MEEYWHKAVNRSVTLKDVAEAAGVSSSAASLILNGSRSGTRVSVLTRQRVLQTADRLEYRPHQLAQSLAKGTTNRIGFYSGSSRLDCRNPFFAEVLGGIFDQAEEFAFDTVVHTSGQNPSRLVDLVRSAAVDGLVVYAGTDDPILAVLDDLLIPAVAIADRVGGLPTVVVDDCTGGDMLARHLATQGCKHAMVKQSPFPPASAIDRVSAFVAACSSSGILTTVVHEIWGGPPLSSRDLQIIRRSEPPVTAIMCWSDGVAESICVALDEEGIEPGEEIAVLGFDGFTRHYTPKYEWTTIRAPWAGVGRQAVRYLRSLIRGESIPMNTALDVSLQVGPAGCLRQ